MRWPDNNSGVRLNLRFRCARHHERTHGNSEVPNVLTQPPTPVYLE